MGDIKGEVQNIKQDILNFTGAWKVDFDRFRDEMKKGDEQMDAEKHHQDKKTEMDQLAAKIIKDIREKSDEVMKEMKDAMNNMKSMEEEMKKEKPDEKKTEEGGEEVGKGENNKDGGGGKGARGFRIENRN